MSLRFDGIDDEIRVAIGGCNLTGALTMAAVLKRDTSGVWASVLSNQTSAAAAVVSMEFSSSDRLCLLGATTAGALTVQSADGFVCVAITKTAGTTTPRAHVFKAGAWTHVDMDNTVANAASQAAGSVRLGTRGGIDRFAGCIAVAAEWQRALSDAEIETLVTGGRSAWKATTPAGMWEPTTAALTDLMAGGATEAARVGTVDAPADIPSFYSYQYGVLAAQSAGASTTAGALTTAPIAALAGQSDGASTTAGALTTAPITALAGRSDGASASAGNLSALRGQPIPRPAVVTPRVAPLGLSVSILAADGNTYRWDDHDPDAANRPKGLSFSTKRGDGFATANCTLARRIDRDYPDLNLFDEITIVGDGGSIAWEGRLTSPPRSFDAGHSISPQCAGWMSHARDRKFSMVYVDRDLGSWGEAPRAQRINQMASYRFHDFSVAPDPGGYPALVTTISDAWAVKPIVEVWYDAGPNNKIAKLFYDVVPAGDTSSGDANWWWDALICKETHALGGYTLSANLRAANSVGYLTATTPQRYASVQHFYTVATAGGAGARFETHWRRMAVYGDHGLPLIGTDPKGVAASEVIKHIVKNYCPKLNADGVVASSYPIPHLAFKERTDPYDAFLDVNKYHLFDLGVYDNKTLFWRPIDRTDYDWEIRLSDHGTKADLQGDTIDDLANGIVVEFDNVATGQREVLLPSNYPALRDPNPANPATQHNTDRWTELQLSSPTTPEAALELGDTALTEFNSPKAPGTLTTSHYVRDRYGRMQPAWKVRAGDRLVISDHPNDAVRVINETNYDHDSKTLTIAVDTELRRLDASFDRLATALAANNLA